MIKLSLPISVLAICLTASSTVHSYTIDECKLARNAALDGNQTYSEQYETKKNYTKCIRSADEPASLDLNSLNFISNLPPKVKSDNQLTIQNILSTMSSNASKSSTSKTEEIAAAKKAEDESGGVNNFMGQNFGIGFAVSFHDGDIVDEAAVVNNVVVENATRDKEARVLLEFHQLIACNNNYTNTDFGCGPFAALVTSDQDVLGGVGVGWLWSWRDRVKNDGSGFSVGFGVILDNDVKDLADGFKVGQPLPTGETAIRFTKESRTSYLLFLTNNF